MLERLSVKGFRILRDFVWSPRAGLNIIVGENSAGKSTILDAVELVTRGTVRGQSFRSSPSPDLFNTDDVADFFETLSGADWTNAVIPEFEISATFSCEPSLAPIRGCNGPEGATVDAPGLVFTCSVPPELRTEFLAESKRLVEDGAASYLPAEYYKCSWRSFKGDWLLRRPKGVVCSRVDTSPEPYSRAVDSYARSILGDELDEETIRGISGSFRRLSSEVDENILAKVTISCSRREPLGLQIDRSSRSDWRNSVVLQRGGLPLSVLGSAEQTLTKCAVSMTNAGGESLLLLEEPECHLSHTSLNELIGIIESATANGRQIFVTTHSPFVLNRLGLDRMAIVAHGKSPSTILDLSNETVRYFKKQSGYDTLRLVLSKKSVLVEGPTDEMVFIWAYRKMKKDLPQSHGVDVIECGIQHRRLLELAKIIDKRDVVALRDNDGKPAEHWIEKAEGYLGDGRHFLCGDLEGGRTIEPQMVNSNRNALPLLARIVGSDDPSPGGLVEYMTDNKTDWALRLLEEDPEVSNSLNVPIYISEAIDIVGPASEETRE